MAQTSETETTQERPPYGWAVGVGTLVFLLYAVTLSPTTAFWDTSEYIATAHILGIPHPPGNPLFVLLARTTDILLSPLGLTTAVRINVFSALMSAIAHGLWTQASALALLERAASRTGTQAPRSAATACCRAPGCCGNSAWPRPAASCCPRRARPRSHPDGAQGYREGPRRGGPARTLRRGRRSG